MRNVVLQAPFATGAHDAEYPQLWNGMVFGWSANLGITGGIIRDRSGKANHGTLTSMDPATDWVRTANGLALDFDGSNDYVLVPASPNLNITGPITLEAWVIPSSVSGKVIIGGYQPGGTFPGYALAIGVSVSAKISYYSGSTGWVTSTASVSTGVLSHVAVSVSGTTATFFLNGNNAGTSTSAVPNSYTGAKAIAATSGGGDYYAGSMLSVVIRNRATSISELQAAYSLGPGGWARRKSPTTWYVPPSQLVSPYVVGGGICMPGGVA